MTIAHISGWRVTRDYRIAEKHARGMTFSAIGVEHNLTAERISQIVRELEQRPGWLFDRLIELLDERRVLNDDIREVIAALREDREERELVDIERILSA